MYRIRDSIAVGGQDVNKVKQWSGPEIGWIKINSDGAFDMNNKEAGSGVIARSSEGKFVAGTNRKFTAGSAVQAEAMAVKDAVNLAIERKFQKVCFEMDSKELILVLTNKCSNIDWKIRPLVLDIQRLLKLISERKMMLISKEANAAANWIAVNSRRGMCMSGWDRHLPSTLVRILNKDGLPCTPIM